MPLCIQLWYDMDADALIVEEDTSLSSPHRSHIAGWVPSLLWQTAALVAECFSHGMGRRKRG